MLNVKGLNIELNINIHYYELNNYTFILFPNTNICKITHSYINIFIVVDRFLDFF